MGILPALLFLFGVPSALPLGLCFGERGGSVLGARAVVDLPVVLVGYGTLHGGRLDQGEGVGLGVGEGVGSNVGTGVGKGASRETVYPTAQKVEPNGLKQIALL